MLNDNLKIPEERINKNCREYYEEININTWKQAKEIFSLFSKEWIFRGQEHGDWRLLSSLERAKRVGYISLTGIDLEVIKIIKERVFEEKFIDKLVKNHRNRYKYPETNLGWLSFAQHHGGLTELLDFTECPFIACFFALGLDKCFKSEISLTNECAVWSINSNWCIKQTLKNLNIDISDLSSFFDKFYRCEFGYDKYCVYPFKSEPISDRAKMQKSIFLFKYLPDESFETNLTAGNNFDENKSYIKKIIIPTDMKENAQKELSAMGITRDEILPGEDYFKEMHDWIRNIQESLLQAARTINKGDVSNRKKGSGSIFGNVCDNLGI